MVSNLGKSWTFYFGISRAGIVWDLTSWLGILRWGCENWKLLEIYRFDHNLNGNKLFVLNVMKMFGKDHKYMSKIDSKNCKFGLEKVEQWLWLLSVFK